jgi:hypothetical protein
MEMKKKNLALQLYKCIYTPNTHTERKKMSNYIKNFIHLGLFLIR